MLTLFRCSSISDRSHEAVPFCHLILSKQSQMERTSVKLLEQVWVSDITSIRLREEFVYLVVLMDVFSRGIRGWHLGRSLDQSLTLRA